MDEWMGCQAIKHTWKNKPNKIIKLIECLTNIDKINEINN